MFEIVGVFKENDLTYVTTSPRHPRARNKKGRYPMHIVRAENALGRLLKRSETVIHIDGFVFNNDLANLAIVKGAEQRSLAELDQTA